MYQGRRFRLSVIEYLQLKKSVGIARTDAIDVVCTIFFLEYII